MSRYGPQVLPESGGAGEAGRAIADALMMVQEHRRRKRQDEQADEDREYRRGRDVVADERQREQDQRQRVVDAIALHNAGYREGEPLPDPNGEDLAGMVAAQRGNATQMGTAAPAPAPDPRGNVTQMGMAPAAPPPPSAIREAGQQFYRLAGVPGYIDPSATPEARQGAREEARDTRTGERQDARDTATAGREDARDQRTATREDARDTRTATREDARDDRRYGRERDLGRERDASAERRARIRAQGGGDGVAGDPLNPKTLDARGRIVGQQLGAAERVLDDEGAELETEEYSGITPDSTDYHAIAAEIDSLRGVQGEISAARGGEPGARGRITRGIQWSDYKRRIHALELKRDRALGMGLDPQRVNAAYAQDVAQLAAAAGLAGGQ